MGASYSSPGGLRIRARRTKSEEAESGEKEKVAGKETKSGGRRDRLARSLSSIPRRWMSQRRSSEKSAVSAILSGPEVPAGVIEPAVETQPSVRATEVAIDWRTSATSSDQQCNMRSVESEGAEVEVNREWKRSSRGSQGGRNHLSLSHDSSLGNDLNNHRHYSEDFAQDFLLHIIRYFPFPSPKPSPRTSPRASPKEKRRKSWEEKEAADKLPQERRRAGRNSTPSLPGPSRQHRLFPPIRRNHSSSAEAKATANGGGGIKQTMETLKMMAAKTVDTMAITALPLDCWLRERLKHFCQLSGHEGNSMSERTIIPASDHTLWKKRTGNDCHESQAYKKFMDEPGIRPFVPEFKKEVVYKGETFIEIEDLTSRFSSPAVMDVKMGVRTFLESEVVNPSRRKDLYQKMVKLDPAEPTDIEHEEKAVTKLRYMQFRERESSTQDLGFRIEAMKLPNEKAEKSFQKVKTREEVLAVLLKYMGSDAARLRTAFLDQLRGMRSAVEKSEFFESHEVIGSSLLFIYDANKTGVWMIDFAKSVPLKGRYLSHRGEWELGNHEDGYLTGLDSLIEILESHSSTTASELS